jgi:phage N-6-adenine-methyltransferase
MSKATTHQVNVEKNDTWETPKDILLQACKKYKINPTLDVCATQQNRKYDNYFGKETDALKQEWNEDFFMNPPYSEIESWMEKAYEQHRKFNVDALILVFSKTGTKWWHKYVEDKAEIHFQKGRIRFQLNGIEPRFCKDCKIRSTELNNTCPSCNHNISKSSPTYDSVWIIFRKTDKICQACGVNPLFENQITCEQCHDDSCKPEEIV